MALMKSIAPDRCQQELQTVGGSDFGFAFGDAARFRVSIFKQRGNIAMVLRQIPNKLLSMDELGLPKACEKLIKRPRGLFLVTGPTGSGKSTSLASMINYLNETVDHHIITIEDPIEFYHYNKKSTVNQREIGVDVPSFSEALRRALRQDPDVILVGELRDLATIEAAITRRRNRARRVRHAAHQQCPGNGQPHHRRLSDQSAGPDSHPAFHVDHRRAGPGPGAEDRRRPHRLLRNVGGHAGHRQPDPREQDVSHHVGHSDRGQVRHDPDGRLAVQSVARGKVRQGGGAGQGSHRPTNWICGSPRPNAGIFEDEGRGRRRDGDAAALPRRRPLGVTRRTVSSDGVRVAATFCSTQATQVAVWQCGGSARSWSTWASSPTSSWSNAARGAAAAARASGWASWPRSWATSPTSSWPRPWPSNGACRSSTWPTSSCRPRCLGYVTEPMAQLYRIVPVSFRDNTLTIAVCDPQNLTVQDELRTFLGYEIRAVVATERDITAALDRYYSASGESVESLVADMESDKELAKMAEMVNRDGPIDLDSFEAAADSAPVRKLLNMVLLLAIKDQASDLHFEPFEDEFRIRIKADGVLYEMVPPPRHLAFAITTRIKVMAKLDIAERRVPQDGRIELTIGGHPVDLRVSVLPTMFGESVVMRVLDRSVVSLDLNKVGMDQPTLKPFRTVMHKPNGIILVTGPTGSGKTTTLYSALSEMNDIKEKLITTEDPVEYVIDGIVQVRDRRRRSATRSPLACGRSCGKIPTGFWSARSATPRRPKSPCRPR